MTTAAFLNAAVGQLYGTFSEKKIRSLLKIEDAEQDDLALLKRVVDNAKLYFVDFYSAELMVTIEIDEDTHASQEQYDKRRTENLNKYGVEVIRYTNAEVVNNLEGVYQDLCERISVLKSAKSRTPKSPLSGGLALAHYIIPISRNIDFLILQTIV